METYAKLANLASSGWIAAYWRASAWALRPKEHPAALALERCRVGVGVGSEAPGYLAWPWKVHEATAHRQLGC